MLRDVFSAEAPMLLRQADLYATAAIVGGTAYLLLKLAGLEQTYAVLVGMAAVVGLRLAALLWSCGCPLFGCRTMNKPALPI